MKYKNIIDEDVIAGTPAQLESEIKEGIIYQIEMLDKDNYQDIRFNLRNFIDVIEEIEYHYDEEFILFRYNPMGAWYKVEDKEDIEYYKEETRI